MTTLEVNAINPGLVEHPFGLGLPFRLGSSGLWELTCGFCRTRFSSWMLYRLPARCPVCGTLNQVRREASPSARR